MKMKIKIIYLLLLVLLVVGCLKKEPPTSLNEEDGFLNGFIFGFDIEEYSMVGIHKDESFFSVKLNNENNRIEHIVYKHSNEDPPILVEMNERGLPDYLYIDDVIIVFGNYRIGLVDVSIIYPDGTIDIEKDIDIDDHYFNHLEELLGDSNIAKIDLNRATISRWVGHGLGIATCVGSIAAAGKTFGALSPLIKIGCGSTAINVLMEFTPRDNEAISTATMVAGTAVGVTGCINANVSNCWMALASASNSIYGAWEETKIIRQQKIAKTSAYIRFSGVWNHVDVEEWYLIFELEQLVEPIYNANHGCYNINLFEFIDVDGDIFTYKSLNSNTNLQFEFILNQDNHLTITRIIDGIVFNFEKISKNLDDFNNICNESINSNLNSIIENNL